MELKRDLMRDHIKRVLLDRIFDGTYKPGERLVELKIAKELNSSQGPVREAFRDLEGLGILESQRYKGTFVRAFSDREMREAFQVRAVLEELASELCRDVGGLVERLEATFEDMVQAALNQDAHRYAERDMDFHRSIVEFSANSALIEVWDSITLKNTQRLTAIRLPNLHETALQHRPIINAFRQEDCKSAGKVLRILIESFYGSTAVDKH